MNEVAKGQFKWKFYRLTILLNLVVLFIAFAVILVIIGPAEYRIPVATILIFGAAFLLMYLLRQYKLTKKWLEEQG